MSLRVLMAMILAGTSLAGTGALAGQEPSPLAVDDPEAYRVYASLLSITWPGGAPWTGWAAKTPALEIHQETSTSDCMFARGKLIDRSGSFLVVNGVARPITPDDPWFARPLPDPTWQPVLDAYLAAQPTVRTVLPGQELGFPYTLVMRANSDSRGSLQMSAAGFDPARARAMVYMTFRCGALCSRGALYLLEKVDGHWRKKSTLCQWVS